MGLILPATELDSEGNTIDRKWQGLLLPAAYAKIVNIFQRGAKAKVHVTLGVFASQEARLNNEAPLYRLNLHLDSTDTISYKDMYNQIKLLPSFIGAVDVDPDA